MSKTVTKKCVLTLFLLQCAHMASFSKTFDFNFRGDHQKNSYERRDYEWVDVKSLS